LPPGEDEAGPVAGLLSADCSAGRPRLPKPGAGGGPLAAHLQARSEMTLVNFSPRMLEQGRRLNPECRHLTGGMRRPRLGERIDAAPVFDLISQMTKAADMLATMRRARAGCWSRGGGRR